MLVTSLALFLKAMNQMQILKNPPTLKFKGLLKNAPLFHLSFLEKILENFPLQESYIIKH